MPAAIFPARFYATDMGNWVQSPELARCIWMRIRIKGLIWYATDFEILAPDRIQLFVYEMGVAADSGRKIYDTEVTEFTPEEKAMLDNIVLGLYTRAAVIELLAREEEERARQVLAIRKELFGV